MEVIRKAIPCKSRLEFYELHLAIINPLLPNKLTEKEILILASFMSVDEKLVEDDRFNSVVRKKVMQKHNLSAGGLGNYLKSMIKKGFLSKSKITGRIKIKDFMLPKSNVQGYEFKIGYKPVEETSLVEKMKPLQEQVNKQTEEAYKLAEEKLNKEDFVVPNAKYSREYKQEYPVTPDNAFHQAAKINPEDDFEGDEDQEDANEKPHKMT
jgi:hypothetical protein